MSSPSQRLVQSYLERHEIGKLFEDMMAKLIKEMPNEPIVYLLRFLQKINQRSIPQNTFPSSILYRPGMELTGSSIPLKYSKDPQVVLPGSRPTTSSWMESSGKDGISGEHSNSNVNKCRSYEKPWLVGSKQSKGISEKKEMSDPPSWNTDAKTKSIDDLFEQVQGDEKNTVESPSVLKEQQRQKKSKDKWSDEPPVNEKENNVPHTVSNVVLLQYNPINSEKTDNFNDELKIESPRQAHDSKKKICSPQTYSKFKRTIAKKKSFERKEKLQALLSTDNTKATCKEENYDSTDNEGDNIIEDANELSLEGARSKTTGGLKRTYHKPTTDGIKVSVCLRCAQVMGDSNLKHVPNNVTSPMLSASEDFASVSQLDREKSYKPAWASVSNSETEHEDVIDRTDKVMMSNSPKKGVLKNKSNIIQTAEQDKTDFFETNNPIKNKARRFAGNFISDNESDFTEVIKVALPKKAWQQRFADTGSDGDVEDAEVEMKGLGWKQKVAISDVNSDI